MRLALFLLFLSPLFPSVSFFFLFHLSNDDERRKGVLQNNEESQFLNAVIHPFFFPCSFRFRLFFISNLTFPALLLFPLPPFSSASNVSRRTYLPNKPTKRNGETVSEKRRKEGTRFCLRPQRSFAPLKQLTGANVVAMGLSHGARISRQTCKSRKPKSR